jgi:hypothetical protein
LQFRQAGGVDDLTQPGWGCTALLFHKQAGKWVKLVAGWMAIVWRQVVRGAIDLHHGGARYILLAVLVVVMRTHRAS